MMQISVPFFEEKTHPTFDNSMCNSLKNLETEFKKIVYFKDYHFVSYIINSMEKHTRGVFMSTLRAEILKVGNSNTDELNIALTIIYIIEASASDTFGSLEQEKYAFFV